MISRGYMIKRVFTDYLWTSTSVWAVPWGAVCAYALGRTLQFEGHLTAGIVLGLLAFPIATVIILIPWLVPLWREVKIFNLGTHKDCGGQWLFRFDRRGMKWVYTCSECGRSFLARVEFESAPFQSSDHPLDYNWIPENRR